MESFTLKTAEARKKGSSKTEAPMRPKQALSSIIGRGCDSGHVSTE